MTVNVSTRRGCVGPAWPHAPTGTSARQTQEGCCHAGAIESSARASRPLRRET